MVLEELCINESTVEEDEEINVELVQDTDPKSTVLQTESSNPKNPAVLEETRAASVAPDVEMDAAEKAASANNDVEMKEIHREETRRSQETAETQADPRTKENLLKRSVANSAQIGDVEAKRARLQREDSKRSGSSSSSRINVPGPSAVVHQDNAESLKSMQSAPRIRRIETVHYNTDLLPKQHSPVRRPSLATSSIFSPPIRDYCESIISFDQDFTKGCHLLGLMIFSTCRVDLQLRRVQDFRF